MPLFSILLSMLLFSSDVSPEELGRVEWLRDYDEALALSEANDKPVLILFQEVPGCSTCKSYGNDVLSHPFIVEAIEDEFIPLVIYNNKGGSDRKVLDLYKEPTWNNPVVRIVNSKGKNIVQRLYSNYSQKGIVDRMIASLLSSNKVVPEYLHQFRQEIEISEGPLKESYVSMYCFWTGEKVIGNINGVAETEAGFMDGKEVVKFKYNPEIVSYEDIISKANKEKCADKAYTDDELERRVSKKVTKAEAKEKMKYRSDRTPQYYLANTTFQYIPMSAYQASKINAALGRNDSAAELLSPRQIKLLKHIEKNRALKWETVYKDDFKESWWKLYGKWSIKS